MTTQMWSHPYTFLARRGTRCMVYHHAESQAKARRSFTKCGPVPVRGAAMYEVRGKGSSEGRPGLTLIGPASTTSDLDYSKGRLQKTPGELRLTFRAGSTNVTRTAMPNHNKLLPLGPHIHLSSQTPARRLRRLL